MRRSLLLTFMLVLTCNLPISPTADTQQLGGDRLPNPEDYRAAANCKNKSKLAPSVTVPSVPGTQSQYRCVLSFYNCETDKTEIYRSEPHGPVANCEEYWARKDALAEREVCCDSPGIKCEESTPWFNPQPGCKDMREPRLYFYPSNTVSVEICGYTAFRYAHPNEAIILEQTPYRQTLLQFIKSRIGSNVCCEAFRDRLNYSPGATCNPVQDMDCDGKPDETDTTSLDPSMPNSLPDFNVFTRSTRGSVDPFPPGLGSNDPNFIPPADKCDCKWELIRGNLTCSPDGKQSHVYQARWRCPSNGNERFTRKEAPANAPCTPPQR